MPNTTNAELVADNARLQAEVDMLRTQLTLSYDLCDNYVAEADMLRTQLYLSYDLCDKYLEEINIRTRVGKGTLQNLIGETNQRLKQRVQRSIGGQDRRQYDQHDIVCRMNARKDRHRESFIAASEHVAGYLEADPTTIRRNYNAYYKQKPPLPI